MFHTIHRPKVGNKFMKITVFLILEYSTIFVYGQNLVQNHSFELYRNCPDGFTVFEALHWEQMSNHPGNADYFNSCSLSALHTVPDNTRGAQEVFEGNAYGGILAFSPTGAREYIQTQLSEPLIENQTYEISMFISLAEDSNLAVDRLGARLTNTSLTGNGNSYDVSGFSEIYSQQIIIDKINWVQIKGDYIAEGGEEFFTIGNFYSNEDTMTSIVDNHPFSDFAYYYIDSISVINKTLSTKEVSFANGFEIYPNPFLSHLNLKFDNINNIKKIEIYSTIGKIITLIKISTRLDLSQLNSGIYFIKVTNKNSEVVVKKIIKD